VIGGIVIEASESKSRPELIFVDCRGTGCERSSTCGIYVEKNAASLQIEIGDQIWWQGRRAYWTPRLPGNATRGAKDVGRDIPIPRIEELEKQLTEAKATQIKDLKAQIKTRDKRISELNIANLSRPETDKISTMVAGILTGLRYIQFVSDDGDLNRQTFCGLMKLCQLILRECGADANMLLSTDQMHEILLSYYATLPQRDIDSLQDHGQFYAAKPGPYGLGFKFVTTDK